MTQMDNTLCFLLWVVVKGFLHETTRDALRADIQKVKRASWDQFLTPVIVGQIDQTPHTHSHVSWIRLFLAVGLWNK